MFEFLPYPLNKYVALNANKLCELRIRKNQPIIATLLESKNYVYHNGQKIIASGDFIENIILSACKNSIYVHNETIKNGYISCGQGIRIGLGGECVYNNEGVQTIKNFSSLCIRFPHQIIGISTKALNIINDDYLIKSVLIISPPGIGKTTLIRDLARNISNQKNLNILVIDEKNEIFYEGVNLGDTCDVISNCRKNFGFYNAIKTLNPEVIIADEISSFEDAKGACFASLSGTKIICTAHGKSLKEVMKKDYMKELFENHCFEKFILLKKEQQGFSTHEVFIE
ncbi:MAG: AAA family ATPase [Clostridia bacterium]|nr:AAA family ATPase [Clostridia bacterium]